MSGCVSPKASPCCSRDAIGHARTWKYTKRVTLAGPLPLELDSSLLEVVVAYETYGPLNSNQGDP